MCSTRTAIRSRSPWPGNSSRPDTLVHAGVPLGAGTHSCTVPSIVAMTPSVGVVKLGGHTQISRGMMVMVIEAAYANGTGVANALRMSQAVAGAATELSRRRSANAMLQCSSRPQDQCQWPSFLRASKRCLQHFRRKPVASRPRYWCAAFWRILVAEPRLRFEGAAKPAAGKPMSGASVAKPSWLSRSGHIQSLRDYRTRQRRNIGPRASSALVAKTREIQHSHEEH